MNKNQNNKKEKEVLDLDPFYELIVERDDDSHEIICRITNEDGFEVIEGFKIRLKW